MISPPAQLMTSPHLAARSPHMASKQASNRPKSRRRMKRHSHLWPGGMARHGTTAGATAWCFWPLMEEFCWEIYRWSMVKRWNCFNHVCSTRCSIKLGGCGNIAWNQDWESICNQIRMTWYDCMNKQPRKEHLLRHFEQFWNHCVHQSQHGQFLALFHDSRTSRASSGSVHCTSFSKLGRLVLWNFQPVTLKRYVLTQSIIKIPTIMGSQHPLDSTSRTSRMVTSASLLVAHRLGTFVALAQQYLKLLRSKVWKANEV